MKNRQKDEETADKRSSMQIPSCLLSTLSPNPTAGKTKRINEDLLDLKSKRSILKVAETPPDQEIELIENESPAQLTDNCLVREQGSSIQETII